jgi:hypothetical protein
MQSLAISPSGRAPTQDRPPVISLWAILTTRVEFSIYRQQRSIACGFGDFSVHRVLELRSTPRPRTKPVPNRREPGPKRESSTTFSRAPGIERTLVTRTFDRRAPFVERNDLRAHPLPCELSSETRGCLHVTPSSEESGSGRKPTSVSIDSVA